MINYPLILTINYVGKPWDFYGDSYGGLVWKDESPKPTQAELDALWESTQTAQIAKQEAAAAVKTSALSKLAKLGLTDAEIKALTGN
jgi:hypothetical protein